MKVSITEFRDMVAEAVRRTLREAKKKPKEIPPRSEESILAQRERQVRALPGYAHGNVLDMSKPLGRKNRAKLQGASGMGGWTSESVALEGPGTNPQLSQEDIAMLIDALEHLIDQTNGTHDAKANQLIAKLRGRGQGMVDPAAHGLDDPSELGIEAKTEAVRHLIRMIVDEEIRVSRGR